MRVFEGLVFMMSAIPGLLHFRAIGQASNQWSGFAGCASAFELVNLLPWIAWSVVPFVFWTVDRGIASLKSPAAPIRDSICPGDWSFLGVEVDRRQLLFRSLFIGIGLTATVWLTTVLNIAPLMHRRYIIGAYPAFLIIGILLLSNMRSRICLVVAGLATVLFLGWQQGTLSEWSHGRWVAWQRQEDWRGAAEFLNARSTATEPVFVAPMLVETQGDRLSERLPTDYLVAPLTTIYPVPNPARLKPLPNGTALWSRVVSDGLAEASSKVGWLVARTGDRSVVDRLRRTTSESDHVGKSVWCETAFTGGRLQILRIEAVEP